MARTIAEIKQEMTDAFMGESVVREKYGFSSTDTFETRFSKVSIEGLLFYVVAFGVWVLEKLFDTHKEEVATMLADLTPHTTRWYRNRVLSMVPSGQTEPPVKYCSVDDRGCRLKVKIAGGSAGARQPVSSDTYNAVLSYLAEEKDAGLKIDIVNLPGDEMSVRLTVWYSPLELVPSDKPVEAALKEYVSNLDFDGLLSRNAIVDELRKVPGVEMVRIDQLLTRYAQNTWHEFGEQEQAESGYWNVPDANITVVYERYTRGTLL